jgi:phospholipase D1/2
VRLYHDAHQTPGPVADVPLSDGKPYEERSCWDDVFDAIMNAQHFIWITGWSVWVNTVLKRHGNWSRPLGDLLKMKAKKGVKVRNIWVPGWSVWVTYVLEGRGNWYKPLC